MENAQEIALMSFCGTVGNDSSFSTWTTDIRW
jgi:hypothetical protein